MYIQAELLELHERVGYAVIGLYFIARNGEVTYRKFMIPADGLLVTGPLAERQRNSKAPLGPCFVKCRPMQHRNDDTYVVILSALRDNAPTDTILRVNSSQTILNSPELAILKLEVNTPKIGRGS